jgi:hypothetical protein
MMLNTERGTAAPALSRRALLAGLGGAVLPALLPLVPARALAAAGDGLALARRVHARADGQDVSSAVTMSLGEEGKQPRVRKMVVYRSNGEKGEKSNNSENSERGDVATLIRFTAPADIDGTGLLTLDAADGATNQWIYLPAMQRVRRVDSNRQGGRFVNSDYYFEDLRDRKPSADTHRIAGLEKLSFGVSDTLCEVLESVPVQADNSVYLKRLAWIEPKSLLPLRLDFFERQSDQPSKRLLVTRREQVQGYWTVMDSTLTDLQTGHQTRLAVEKVLYDRQLPASLFTSRALADERQERGFRP